MHIYSNIKVTKWIKNFNEKLITLCWSKLRIKTMYARVKINPDSAQNVEIS